MDTVYAAWVSNTFLPSTDWVPCGAVNFIRARWEFLDRTGNLRLAPGFQVANRENAAGAFNNIGSQQTAEGIYEINWTDVRSYTDDKQLLRLGWVTRNTSGTSLSMGRMRCRYELLLACGSVVRCSFGFAHGLHAGVMEKVEGDLEGINDRSFRVHFGRGGGVGDLWDEGASWVEGESEVEPRSLDDASKRSSHFVFDEEQEQTESSPMIEEVWGGAETSGLGMDYTLQPIPSEPWPGAESECPPVESPLMQMPDFTLVHEATQRCFVLTYGLQDWPATGCCFLPTQVVTACGVPDYADYMVWVSKMRKLNFEDKFRSGNPPNQGSGANAPNWVDPSKNDLILYFSAITLIAQNMDIVRWAACHVEKWSPEIVGLGLADRLSRLLFSESGRPKPEMAVMFVDAADPVEKPTGGATGWAIVRGNDRPADNLPVTIIIPLNHDLWGAFLYEYGRGGDRALCAVSQLAQIILHEMVHVEGDKYRVGEWRGYGESTPWSGTVPPYLVGRHRYGYPGTLHDDNVLDVIEDEWTEAFFKPYFSETCWDEARMIASMFVWGIHHRYTCLANTSNCNYMVDPQVFANSILGGR